MLYQIGIPDLTNMTSWIQNPVQWLMNASQIMNNIEGWYLIIGIVGIVFFYVMLKVFFDGRSSE